MHARCGSALALTMLLVLGAGLFSGVAAFSFSSASDQANAQADRLMGQERSYQNATRKGPGIIVLTGEIKSNNATFRQKVTANNIKDYAELELSRANFTVLERGDLDPMLAEQQLARQMGADRGDSNPGQFKTTRWFARFDILKAEPVAATQQGFDGQPIGDITGTLIGPGKAGRVSRTVGSSVGAQGAADIWVIGLRYKVIDGATSEQVAGGYFEKKMEHNAEAGRVLGFSQSAQHGVTLDSMVQQLVQEAVADLDRMK